MRKKTEGASERLESRKHKALRRTLIFLAVVTAASALKLYGFLPISGLRNAEEINNTGRTSIVRRVYRPNRDEWNKVTYFSANEYALLLSRSQYIFPYGWMDSSWAVVDCSRREEPAYCGVWMMGSGGEEEDDNWRALHVRSFGRVDDPDVASVAVSFRVPTGYNEAENQILYEERYRQESARDDWTERDGGLYFLMETERMEWGADEGLYPFLIAYDDAGIVLTEYDVYDWVWS